MPRASTSSARVGLLALTSTSSPEYSFDVLSPGFESAVRAVGWAGLRSTYGSGEIVRDIVLRLGSRDEARVRWAWGQMSETVLQHQGTVYPATAAAAPFLCQIALDEAALWRAALIADLAFMSTGYDEPYAPAGTALAVRDGVRPYLGELFNRWSTADPGLDMALVALSAAFPVATAPVAAQLTGWFGRSEPPLRTALGLALGFHGLADQAAQRIIEDEVAQSVGWVVRTGGLLLLNPEPGPDGFPRPEAEPYVHSPVPQAIQVAERWRAGAEEQVSDLNPVRGLISTLMELGAYLIDYPS